MVTAIKLKKSSAEKVWELIDQYADMFDAASLIPIFGAGSIVSVIGKILAKGQMKELNNDPQIYRRAKLKLLIKW